MARHHNRTILVTGATGHQGGAALRHLRERGFPVRALTRDPGKPAARQLETPGIEVVRGDLSDPASLTRALDGMSGVYSVQNSRNGFDTEVSQARNLVDAANRQEVDHFVYSSVASADRNTGIPHFDSKFRIENHLRASGLRYTIIRPVFFMENLLAMKPSIEQGVFKMPLKPETRLQMIAVDDIGAFIAMSFEHPGHWQNRVEEIAGDERSMEELAEAFSRATGKDVKYIQTPWNEFEQQAGKEMATMFQWFEREGYHVDIADVRRERPQLRSFDHWLNTTWRGTADRIGGAGR